MLVYAFFGAIVANLITAMFIAALWRLRRNERDGAAIILALFCCAITVLAGYALREDMQAEKTAPEHSSR